MELFKKKKAADKELPAPPAPPKAKMAGKRELPPAPKPSARARKEAQPALPPAPKPPKEKVSVEIKPTVTVSVPPPEIKPSPRKVERAVSRILDKPPTREELMEMRKEVSSIKRQMGKSAPKAERRLPKEKPEKPAPIVNISIFDREKDKGFSLSGRPQPSRQAPRPAINIEKPAAAKAEKAAPVSSRISKPAVLKAAVPEISEPKKAVTGMKKDMKAVKQKVEKVPGKKPARKKRPAIKVARPAPPPRTEKEIRNYLRETDKSISRLSRDLMKLDEKVEEAKEAARNAYMGPLSDSDVKIIKNFVNMSGEFERGAAGLNVKLDKVDKAMDIFSERLDSIRRELTDMKIKQATSRPEKDTSGLEERLNGIEAKLSERKAEKPGAGSKEIKAVLERMEGLEKSLKGMDSPFRSAAVTSLPEISKGATERLDSVDSRIIGMNDKLIQLGNDVQKITEYFLQGMKYTESRLRVIEHDLEAQKNMDMMPRPKPRPAPSYTRPRIPEPAMEEDMDLMLPPRRQMIREPPAPQAPPQPSGPPGPVIGLPTPPLPPSPVPITAPRVQQFQQPPESNMFTKLRESTVVRRPFPRMDPDMHDVDIIVEQITESMHRGDTKEKIERDLLIAGFDADIISRAFMQARVG